MVRVLSHVVEVVVLAAGADALLGVAGAAQAAERRVRGGRAQEDWLELVHPGVGEQVGSSTGTTGLDGHGVCALDSKKPMNSSRTRADGQSGGASIGGPAAVDARRWAAAAAAAGRTLSLAFGLGLGLRSAARKTSRMPERCQGHLKYFS